MAKEYIYEKDVDCQWNCLSNYAGSSSKQYHDNRDRQLSFEKQPQPVSPIAYTSPARRNTVGASTRHRAVSWFAQDPLTQLEETGQPSTTTHHLRHRSWFYQDPYSSSSRPGRSSESHSRTKSWFGHDPYGQPRQSTSSSLFSLGRTRSRPSIGAPTNFRKVTDALPEPMPARQRSFRRLELSIYIEPTGRLSPLPDFSTDEWTGRIPGLDKPASALLRRETVDNSQLSTGFNVPRKPLSTPGGADARRGVVSEPFFLSSENGPGPVITSHDHDYPMPDVRTADIRTPTMAVSKLEDMAASTSQPWSQRSSGYTVSSRLPTENTVSKHSRSESDGRSSKASLRRPKSDAVEEAIKELNTIVEEKRIRAKIEALTSPPLSPTSHKPAIAPTMTVRARSETLSDIGSAFSTSVAAPMPVGDVDISRSFTPSPLPIRQLAAAEIPAASADSSATALPQFQQQSPMQSPKPSNPLKSNPVKTQHNRKDRLSTWLKRVSITPAPATPAPKFYQSYSKEIGMLKAIEARSSTSGDTVITVSSMSSVDAAVTETPVTTVAPSLSSPTEVAPRPSISKPAQHLRRTPKQRGLSVDTTLSNGSRTVPPAYHEIDLHPITTMNGELTPSRIGLAC